MLNPLAPISVPLIAARSTFSSAIIVSKYVVAYEWVTFWTLCLTCVVGTTAYATKRVDSMRHRLQMFGIDAAWVTAKVIKVHSFWNWTYVQFIRHSMSQYGTRCSSASYPAIAVVECCCPFPTVCERIDFKFLCESFRQGAVGWHNA